MNPKVTTYLDKTKKWGEELTALRDILLMTKLEEDYKWRNPCYTFNDKNVSMLGGFKDFCILSFFKGVLMKDPKKLLVQQGENTQSARVMQFTSVEQINELKSVIKSYIKEAIALEKSGVRAPASNKKKEEYPEELKAIFKEKPAYKKAFEKLTPGRQRGYLLYFNGAKQSKTKTSRIEKNEHRILDGYGFHDCTCGLSKRMPNCDGSHKSLLEN